MDVDDSQLALEALSPVEIIALALKQDPSLTDIKYEQALEMLCRVHSVDPDENAAQNLTVAICDKENMSLDSVRGHISANHLQMQQALQMHNRRMAHDNMNLEYSKDLADINERTKKYLESREINHEIQVNCMVTAMFMAHTEKIQSKPPKRFDHLFS